MNVRKAIFDKRFLEKKAIMALYATKNAFSVAVVFGDYVQKQKKYLFGDFSKRRKPTHILLKGCENSLIAVCIGFGLS